MSDSISLENRAVTAELQNREHKFDFKNALYTEYEDMPGIRTFLDFQGDEVITQTIQDHAAILEQNEEYRKNADEMWNASPEWKLVASIPLAQYLEWKRLGITQDSKALLKAIEHDKSVKTTNRRLV